MQDILDSYSEDHVFAKVFTEHSRSWDIIMNDEV